MTVLVSCSAWGHSCAADMLSRLGRFAVETGATTRKTMIDVAVVAVVHALLPSIIRGAQGST